MLESPLLQALSGSAQRRQGFGFLTMDLGRHLVCLMESEELISQVPLVGVWVDLVGEERGGLLEHPAVWAAAARFVHHRHIRERVWVEESTFLLMVVHGEIGRDSPNPSGIQFSFFELRHDSSSAEAVVLAAVDNDGSLQVPAANMPWLYLETYAVELTELSAATRCSENPEVVVPQDKQPSSFTQERLHLQAVRSDDSPRLSTNFRMEQPRALPEPHPQAFPEVQLPAAEHLAVSHLRGAGGLATGWAPIRGDKSWLSSGTAGAVAEVRNSKASDGRSSRNNQIQGSAETPGHSQTSFLPFSRGQSASQEALVVSEEQASLRRLVGQQQDQLNELQQKLSDMHQLLVGLAKTNVQTSEPAKETKAVSDTSRGIGRETSADFQTGKAQTVQAVQTSPPLSGRSPKLTHAGLQAVPVLCDASVNVGDSLVLSAGSLKRADKADAQTDTAVGTEGELNEGQKADVFEAKEDNDAIEIGWRLVVPSLSDTSAATLAAHAPSLRDSADTAGGATPRREVSEPASTAALSGSPTRLAQLQWKPNLAGVPRIIVPSSPTSSEGNGFSDDEALMEDAADLPSDLILGSGSSLLTPSVMVSRS